jgi:biopolymer transport protein ExbB
MLSLSFDPVWSLALQAASTSTSAAAAAGGTSVLDLFRQSFDVFTVLLVLGSLAAGTVIVRAMIEIRAARITPEESERQLRRLLADGNLDGVESFVQRDNSFYAHVLRAGLAAPASGGADRAAIRNASELAASEQCARWFRIIEPLNVIGNLGPLLGLAGTVWGMVIAFNVLSASSGQANPADLSGGIAKALFHTLLGLVVAIPALLVFGLYRSYVDRLCTRAMTISAEMVEMLCDLRGKR